MAFSVYVAVSCTKLRAFKDRNSSILDYIILGACFNSVHNNYLLNE